MIVSTTLHHHCFNRHHHQHYHHRSILLFRTTGGHPMVWQRQPKRPPASDRLVPARRRCLSCPAWSANPGWLSMLLLARALGVLSGGARRAPHLILRYPGGSQPRARSDIWLEGWSHRGRAGTGGQAGRRAGGQAGTGRRASGQGLAMDGCGGSVTTRLENAPP